jgi:hypothetical protein
MTSAQSRRKLRRWTRKMRRGRMPAADAQALSTRTRRDEPTTRAITRFHPRLMWWGGDTD